MPEQPERAAWGGESFRLLAGNVAVHAIFVVDPEGIVRGWGRGAEELFGYREDEVLGRSADRFHTPEDTGAGLPGRERERALGGGLEVDRWQVRKDGRRFWSSGSVSPLRAEGGALRGFALIVRDRTAWWRAEQDRLGGEARTAAVLEAALDAIVTIDHEGRVVEFNPAAERMFGLGRAEALGREMADLIVPPRLREAHRRGLARYLATGEGRVLDRRIEIDARHGDGREFPVELTVTRIPAQGPPRFTAYLRDITERRRAEEALRASEERFRRLADAMPQLVWVTRPDRSVEYVNRRWLDYTGQTLEEALGPLGWPSAVHPDDLGGVLESSVRSHEKGEPFEAEYRIRDAAGVYRWHLGRAIPAFDEEGRLVRRFGAATDIDDRKRAERDAHFLARASAGLAAIVDEADTLRRIARLAVPDFADWCMVDLAGEGGLPRRLAVAHADEATRAAAEEIDRLYPMHPDDSHCIPGVIRTGGPVLVAELTDAMMAAAARDEEHLRLLRALGPRSYVCVPLPGRGGPLGAITFVAGGSGRRFGPNDLRLAEDLAARAAVALENSRFQAELREADRRKDEFLATLAHELRNPLASIRNALLLMRGPAPPGGAEPVRAMAERQVAHLARLVDDLMDVARIGKGKIELRREVVDLRTIVDQAVETARPLIDGRRHRLAVSLPPRPIRLEGDPTRLEQVLWNLLNNAAKYTGPGGRIDLSADREGDEVVLRVRDDGVGIDPETLPLLFQMFVQAGEHRAHSQGGLGIGLGLVRSLVELHGGSITAHSGGPGAGSEFVVRLPALPEGAEAPAPAPPAADQRAAPRGRPPRRRLLVVDDNVDGAESLARLLSWLHGQEVRVAHDGPQALVVAEEFRPEVVLLDIGLPGLDGHEVARRLRERPGGEGVLIVALSGWGQESDLERSRDAGFDHHLVKPADPETIRALLMGAGPRPRRPGG